MTKFVLFDPMSNSYVFKPFGKSVLNWIDAKQYKRFYAARDLAGLMNTGRNLPPGYTVPNRYYQNLPNVEVHEYDVAGNLVQKHPALPVYLDIQI